MLPRLPTTLLPASWMPTRASSTPSRVAIHAPSGMSQIGDPAAPQNTEAMILPVGVSRGR